MALSSMTGFARGHGVSGPYAWAWELKSVNAKGLDLRLRLPAGWDAVEIPVRSRAAEVLTRGTIYGTLTVERQGVFQMRRASPCRSLRRRYPLQHPAFNFVFAQEP